MGVIIIMLLHAVPVYVVGIASKDPKMVKAVATVSALAALFTGKFIFFGFDLLAIFYARALAESHIESWQRSTS